MKASIHPTYYDDAQVICACGNTFTTGSTKPKIQVEICAACHPFFTGEMKYVDTAGRVDKFRHKVQMAQETHYVKKKAKKAAKIAARKAALEAAPQTMKEMMSQAKPKKAKQSKKAKSSSSSSKSSAPSDQTSDTQDDKQ